MLRKASLLTAGLFGVLTHATAQTVTNVTEVITDYAGFWQSGVGAISPVKPDNSHDLLAFSVNGTRYSTGVNDALLTSRNVTFTPGNFRGLPVGSIGGTVTSNTKVGLGALWDGVANGAGPTPPSNVLSTYLRDGKNGLNLGTGIANIPAGTLSFTVTGITKEAVGDNVPDILVTQFADPANSQDRYQFTDENDVVIGNTVTVIFTSISPVGDWTADFYEASQSPMTLMAGFTQTPRQLRLWTADLNTFGITQDNAARIRKFKILLNGNSDVAFVAYNSQTARVFDPLPVQLTSFTGQATATRTTLQWQTAQEMHSAAFEVETSLDGFNFQKLASIAAAGTSTQPRSYSYQHATTSSGPRYYRLRQVDQDGSSTYSAVVVVAGSPRATASIQITAAPNPFRSALHLNLTTTGTKPVQGQVVLATLAGREVYRQDISQQLNSPQVELTHLPELPAGVYTARVTIDGQTSVLKVVRE
jgi:hypothetical protein